MKRGQSMAVLLVYVVLALLLLAALIPILTGQISLVIGYMDNLTQLILRFFPGLIFIIVILGIYESTKPLEPPAQGGYRQ